MQQFDVFLAHNSLDKPQIIEIARHLKQKGLNPWLDKEQILGGDTILEKVFTGIKQSKTGAFFISPNGLGNFQENIELYTVINWFLRQQGKSQSFRVIPILLPGVNNVPEKIEYLAIWRWIQFTKANDKEALDDFIRSIRGQSAYVSESSVIEIPNKSVAIQSQPNNKALDLLNSHLGVQPNNSAIEAVELVNSHSSIQLPIQTNEHLNLKINVDPIKLNSLKVEAVSLVNDLRQYFKEKREEESIFIVPRMIRSSSSDTGEEREQLDYETHEGLIQLSRKTSTDWMVMFRGRAKQIREKLLSVLNEPSLYTTLLPETYYSSPNTLPIHIAEIADEIESLVAKVTQFQSQFTAGVGE